MNDKQGMCAKCGEHTSVDDSCCGGGVWYEGGIEWPADEDADEQKKEE